MAALALVLAQSARAAGEVVYVAVGAVAEAAGTARPGDVAAVADALRASGARVRTVDLTAPSASLRAVREEQLMRAVSARPTLVTLGLHPGDLCGGPSLADFSRDLETVAELLQRTRARVLVSTVDPRWVCGRAAPAARRRAAEAFHWAIVRIAKRHALTLVVLGRGKAGVVAPWRPAVRAALGVPEPAGSQRPPGRDTPSPRLSSARRGALMTPNETRDRRETPQ
jgi:hypothetical protein